MRKRAAGTGAGLLLAIGMIAACQPKPKAEHYPFHGMILQMDTRAHQALIQHDDVPGLMKGMTMPFTIRDEKTLSGLKAGDVIEATLAKRDYDAWLEDVKVVGHEDLGDDKPATAVVPHRPAAGEAVPDFAFTNQGGTTVHLAQFRGRPLLITFIYTRCPLPEFCPRMNANLLAVAKKVNDPRLALMSVSFDLEHDTPAVLRAYSQHWTAGLPEGARGHWQFVVPAKKDLDEVLKFFGMTSEKDGEFLTHTLSTTLVGADGKVVAWYPGNGWTAEDVAGEWERSAVSTQHSAN